MNRFETTELVCALMESATFLDQEGQRWLCVRIGADEQDTAISELLGGFVQHNIALPPYLAVSVWEWIRGFIGTESEKQLRDLATQIQISHDGPLNTADTKDIRVPTRLTPRRSDRAARQMTLRIAL